MANDSTKAEAAAQLIALCPSTSESVELNKGERQLRLENMGIWWECPCCKGWHIYSFDKDQSELMSAH